MSHACFFFFGLVWVLSVWPQHNKGQIDGLLQWCLSLWKVFSSLQRSTEDLSSRSPPWPRPLLPGYKVWPDSQLLTSNVSQRCGFLDPWKVHQQYIHTLPQTYSISQQFYLWQVDWKFQGCDILTFALIFSVNCMTWHEHVCTLPKAWTHQDLKVPNFNQLETEELKSFIEQNGIQWWTKSQEEVNRTAERK